MGQRVALAGGLLVEHVVAPGKLPLQCFAELRQHLLAEGGREVDAEFGD